MRVRDHPCVRRGTNGAFLIDRSYRSMHCAYSVPTVRPACCCTWFLKNQSAVTHSFPHTQHSVEAARRRLKVLEGEYRLIHREMVEAVEEASAFALHWLAAFGCVARGWW